MAKVKLSPPWDIYHQELVAFFKYDEEVHILYDEEEKHIKVYVDNDVKAGALESLLKPEVNFGNVMLTVEVIRPNVREVPSTTDVKNNLINGLKNNDACSFVAFARGIFTNPLAYVVFKPEVVQYWTDNLGDYNGLRTTLFQEIAKEIFVEIPNVCYCTDKLVDVQPAIFGGKVSSYYP